MTDGVTLERPDVRPRTAEPSGGDGSATCLEIEIVDMAGGAGARRSARSRQAMAAGGSGTPALPAGVPGLMRNGDIGNAGLGPIEGGLDGSRLVAERPIAGPRSALDERTCVAAVRAYVAKMADVGSYPGLNGYQRAARERGWPGARTVVARLGSWRQALLIAGFDVPRRPAEAFVTRQDCIAAVAAYAAEAARGRQHPGLVGYERIAAARHWPSRTTITARLGPWTAALRAAGVDSKRCIDRDDCLIAVGVYVAEMTRAGHYPAIRSYDALASRRGWPRAGVVAGQLGSWSAALAGAGFEPTRSAPRRVSRQDCIAAVHAYVAEATMAGRHPGVVGYDAVSKDRGWPQRQSTVMARLGSWSAALSAAGYIDPTHRRGHRVGPDQCLAAVGSYLAEAAEAGTTPSLAGYGKLARSRGWPAVATVLARLGSWQTAKGMVAPPGCESTSVGRNPSPARDESWGDTAGSPLWCRSVPAEERPERRPAGHLPLGHARTPAVSASPSPPAIPESTSALRLASIGQSSFLTSHLAMDSLDVSPTESAVAP